MNPTIKSFLLTHHGRVHILTVPVLLCSTPHSMWCRVYVIVGCPSVRPSVCLSVCPVDSSRLSIHISAADARSQQQAGSVNVVIRGGSTQTCYAMLRSLYLSVCLSVPYPLLKNGALRVMVTNRKPYGSLVELSRTQCQCG